MPFGSPYTEDVLDRYTREYLEALVNKQSVVGDISRSPHANYICVKDVYFFKLMCLQYFDSPREGYGNVWTSCLCKKTARCYTVSKTCIFSLKSLCCQIRAVNLGCRERGKRSPHPRTESSFPHLPRFLFPNDRTTAQRVSRKKVEGLLTLSLPRSETINSPK